MDLSASMKHAASVMGVIPKEGDLFVWDSRNNHCSGPYRACDREKVDRMVSELNQQVALCNLGPLARLAVKIEGPIYVRAW